MFNSDIAIYNFLKKIAIKIVPAFGIKLIEIPIGGIIFDMAVIVSIAYTILSKVNRNLEKVKK